MGTQASEGIVAEAFARSGTRVRYAAGDPLLTIGQQPSGVAHITKGLVKVTVPATNGKESMLGVRGPGAVLGELSVVLGRTHGATAVAIVATEAQVLRPARFEELLASEAVLTRAILEMTAERLAEASTHQHQLATSDSVARVASVLVELGETVGVTTKPGHVAVEFSQQDLANFAGMSRDSMVRALRRLRNDGWIDTQRRSITINDVAALANVASLSDAT